MEDITYSHSKYTYLFSLSRLLERAAYYGIRTVLVLYMISDLLKMDSKEAMTFYAIITSSYYLLQIIGALLGDFLLGNKRSIIIGAFVQAAGCFILLLNNPISFYVGIIVFILGGGLYSQNMVGFIAKINYDRKKLMDAAYLIFYVAVNIGAFLGTLILGYISEVYDPTLAFTIGGILMLAAGIIPLLTKEVIQSQRKSTPTKINKYLLIVIVVLASTLFWQFYNVSASFASEIMIDLRFEFSIIPSGLWLQLTTLSSLIIGVGLIYFWSHKYYSQLHKLIVGFLFAGVSFAVLLLIPSDGIDATHFSFYLLYIILIAIAELHIVTVGITIMTEYVPQKYLSTILSLPYLVSSLFMFLFGLFSDVFYTSKSIGLGIISISSIIIAICLIPLAISKK